MMNYIKCLVLLLVVSGLFPSCAAHKKQVASLQSEIDAANQTLDKYGKSIKDYT